jgi:peptidoglycan/LPS O-acetylase OafA/YrhL
LDGVRGIAALIVFIDHLLMLCGIHSFFHAAGVAVWVFFALSGCVLMYAWDGRYIAFLVRRFVRLWPMYAICLGASYGMAGTHPAWSEFFWWPLHSVRDPIAVNPPTWSLGIEAWAMLFMPVFVWCRSSVIRVSLGIMACVLATHVDWHFCFGIFFILGAWLARFEFRCAPLVWAIPQWLGKISYPFYLSHWAILNYVPGPLIVRTLLCFIVAQALTVTLERWSITASRKLSET